MPIERAGQHQRRTGDARQLRLQVHVREHAVDGAKARRIVAEPAGAMSGKALRITAQRGRVGAVERIQNGVQALALHALYPGQHGGAAVGRDADGGTAGDHGSHTLGEAHGGMQRNGAANSDTGERNLVRDAERVHERHQVVHHGVDGERPAHLLGQPGAARVVAQDAPLG